MLIQKPGKKISLIISISPNLCSMKKFILLTMVLVIYHDLFAQSTRALGWKVPGIIQKPRGKMEPLLQLQK
jgi:hypothetical protein